MKQLVAFIPVLIIAFSPFSFTRAQEPSLLISGQLRHRTEMNGKDFIDSTKVSATTVQRTRLNLSFTSAGGDKALFQVQDTRTYGSETNTLTDGSADALDIHQAYYQINNIGGQPIGAKVGRMELAYAIQRIIGAVGWHNIARSFDGAVATYKLKNISIDALLMIEVEENTVKSSSLSVDTSKTPWNVTETTTTASPKDFRGVWLTSNWKLGGGGDTRVDAYFLNNYNNDGDDLNRTTMGLYSKGTYQLGSLKLSQELDFALQRGTQSDTTDISASLIGVRVGVVLTKVAFKPTLGFGFDLVSGNDPATPKNEAFNTLYATNHKYYGFMDYFLNIPGTPPKAPGTGGYGLQDIILSGGIPPLKGLGLKFDYHMFTTPQAVSINGANKNDLGTELDITSSYNFRPGIKIVAGYSTFTPGAVIKEWRGADTASWSYLMVIYNF